jgi:hypothetical protein
MPTRAKCRRTAEYLPQLEPLEERWLLSAGVPGFPAFGPAWAAAPAPDYRPAPHGDFGGPDLAFRGSYLSNYDWLVIRWDAPPPAPGGVEDQAGPPPPPPGLRAGATAPVARAGAPFEAPPERPGPPSPPAAFFGAVASLLGTDGPAVAWAAGNESARAAERLAGEAAAPALPSEPAPAAPAIFVLRAAEGVCEVDALEPACTSAPAPVKSAAPGDSGPARESLVRHAPRAEPPPSPLRAGLLTEGVNFDLAALGRAISGLVEPTQDGRGVASGTLSWLGLSSWLVAAALACEGARRAWARRAAANPALALRPHDPLTEADL